MKDLVNAVAEMMEDDAKNLTQKYLDQGAPPMEIFEAYKEALAIVGKRFEEGIYFVPELILAGEMMKTASEMMKDLMVGEKASDSNRLGKFLLGTGEGDIHDIGKDMVAMLMDMNGFEVRDLGVDVPAQRFSDAAKEFQPDIVGLSGLLTLSFESMKQVVDALKEIGMRDKVKVIIGGGQVDEHACKYVEADAWVTDAVAGVKYAVNWMEK
ncbi:MAG: cobalamin B12-binding domain-containing protein [Desulfomonile tiedjei]|uniref:Cobalamin B12-binding domain-containing protein n=1 Tax=Desulfomonile tiedjei TaxID=2358 RepID=A0A9D6V1Z2_9BACT|nr:cobalamin B12-binding domain-containing protein [Desulfomonile tiedjei]